MTFAERVELLSVLLDDVEARGIWPEATIVELRALVQDCELLADGSHYDIVKALSTRQPLDFAGHPILADWFIS